MKITRYLMLVMCMLLVRAEIAMTQVEEEIDVVILKFIAKQSPEYNSRAIGECIRKRTDTTMTILSARKSLHELCTYKSCRSVLYDEDSNTILGFDWDGGTYTRFPLDSAALYRDSITALYKANSIAFMIKQLEAAGQKELAEILRSSEVADEGAGNKPVSNDDSTMTSREPDSVTVSIDSARAAPRKRSGRSRGRSKGESGKSNDAVHDVPGGTLVISSGKTKENNKSGSVGHIPADDVFYSAIDDGGTFTIAITRKFVGDYELTIDSSDILDTVAGLPARIFKWKVKTDAYSVSGETWITSAEHIPFEAEYYQQLDSLLDVYVQPDRPDRMLVMLPMGRKFWRDRGLPVRNDIKLSVGNGFFRVQRELVSIEKTRAPLSAFTVPAGYLYESLLEP